MAYKSFKGKWQAPTGCPVAFGDKPVITFSNLLKYNVLSVMFIGKHSKMCYVAHFSPSVLP